MEDGILYHEHNFYSDEVEAIFYRNEKSKGLMGEYKIYVAKTNGELVEIFKTKDYFKVHNELFSIIEDYTTHKLRLKLCYTKKLNCFYNMYDYDKFTTEQSSTNPKKDVVTINFNSGLSIPLYFTNKKISDITLFDEHHNFLFRWIYKDEDVMQFFREQNELTMNDILSNFGLK